MTVGEIVSRAAYEVGDDTFQKIKKDEHLRIIDRTYREFCAKTLILRSTISFETVAGQKEYPLYGTQYATTALLVTGSERRRTVTLTETPTVIIHDIPFSQNYFVEGDYVVFARGYVGEDTAPVSVVKEYDRVTLKSLAGTISCDYSIEAMSAAGSSAEYYGDNILGFFYTSYNGKKMNEILFDEVMYLRENPAEIPDLTEGAVYSATYKDQYLTINFPHSPSGGEEVVLYFIEVPRIGRLSEYVGSRDPYAVVPKLDLQYHDSLVLGSLVKCYKRLESLSVMGNCGFEKTDAQYFNSKYKETEKAWADELTKISRDVARYKDITTPIITHLRRRAFSVLDSETTIDGY